MASFECNVVYIICRIEVTRGKKRIKELKLKEIIAAVCALLNSNGGSVKLVIENQANKGIAVKCSPSSQNQVSEVIRILEQTMISIIGIQLTVANIHFREDKGSIVLSVRKTDSLITSNYNLYLPSQTQVVQVPATDSLENVKDNIISRNVIPQAIVKGSHHKVFPKTKNCNFQESKTVQFKCLKSDASKCTTLTDRITGNGNKFSCYVSAFANLYGGHIYYGIDDDRVVKGQFIPSEDDKRDVTKKVKKVINKMIWPEQIGKPKQGEHWEIFFEPVVDENSKPIPSTFVIVIYIAPCLGGVFAEEPECYEMVEGKVAKMSFATWKKTVLQPVRLPSKEEIPISVGRITWSSAQSRKACSDVHQVLMPLINNGKWKEISKKKPLSCKYVSTSTPDKVIDFIQTYYCALPQRSLQ